MIQEYSTIKKQNNQSTSYASFRKDNTMTIIRREDKNLKESKDNIKGFIKTGIEQNIRLEIRDSETFKSPIVKYKKVTYKNTISTR